MLFNSEAFLVFCAVFFPIYFLCRSIGLQNFLVLIASLIFYGWWNWKFVSLILISIVVNYVIGLLIADVKGQRQKKLLLVAAIAFNLVLLSAFKYASFLLDSVAFGLGTVGVTVPDIQLHIILPVGISFFTFQAMSYIIDIYRGKVECERNLIRFGAYISLFPQLVAGPIVRSDVLLPQLRILRHFSWANLWLGLEMFVIGAALKVLVANRLAPVVDQIYSTYTQQEPLSLLIGTLFFAFQIYGDFAGYSLMAIGVGRIMGLRFPINFRRPYLAVDFSDFWRRWHISLSTWLRDYLYIPLGGNRNGKAARQKNLMITMLLGGLWHGSSWSFVFWGFLHGGYQALQATGPGKRVFSPRSPGYLRIMLQRLAVFTLVCVAWIYFRMPEFSDATALFLRLFDFGAYSFAAVGNKFDVVFGFMIIIVLMSVELVCEDTKWLQIYRRNRAIRMAWAIALIQLLLLFGSFNDAAFIYFQF